MKKFISILLIFVMAISMFAGCAETHVITPIETVSVDETVGFVPSPTGPMELHLYSYGIKDFTFLIKDYIYDEESDISTINIYIKNRTEYDLWVNLDDVMLNGKVPVDWGVRVAPMTERDIAVQFSGEYVDKIGSMTGTLNVTYKDNDEYVIYVNEYIDINFA